MKNLTLSALLGLTASMSAVFGATSAYAQAAGTEMSVINDDNGHFVKLLAPHPLPGYNLNPIVTLGIPPAGNPPAGFMNVGALNNIPRWDGISWVTSGVMLNNNTVASIGTALDNNVRLTIQGDASTDPLDVTNSSGSHLLYVKTSGNTGIGATNPFAKLSVAGNTTVGASYTGAAAPSNGLAVQGNFGIGTTTPVSQLGVNSGMSIGSGYTGSAAGNNLIVEGNTTIGTSTVDNNAKLTVSAGSNEAVKFYSHGTDVLRIKNTAASGTSLSSSQTFMQFYDGNNTGRGSIQGEDGADFASSPDFILESAVLVFDAAGAAANLAENIATLGIRETLGNDAKVICEVAEYTANNSIAGAALGVQYSSGSADYAEYLPLLNPKEVIASGDVVGVFNGKISRKTEGADNLMTVSFHPGVVGNMPQPGHEREYRKIAFMGQVPVKVRGVVNSGDYILASGLDDGAAVAVRPENMTAELYAKKLGRAWASSDFAGLKFVNVAVGLNNEDMQQVVTNREAQIASLKAKVAELQAKTAKVQILKSKLAEIKAAMTARPNSNGTFTNVDLVK